MEPARDRGFHTFGNSKRALFALDAKFFFLRQQMRDLGNEERIALRLSLHRSEELSWRRLSERVL